MLTFNPGFKCYRHKAQGDRLCDVMLQLNCSVAVCGNAKPWCSLTHYTSLKK